jgi:hypothetical protein
MATKMKTAACECGCGNPTIRPDARFLPGHDAKLKSELIKTALGRVPKGAAQPTPQAKAQARNRIHDLGWDSHLVVSEAMDARGKTRKTNGAKGTAVRNAERRAKVVAKKPAPSRAGDTKTPNGGTVPASVGRLAHDPV